MSEIKHLAVLMGKNIAMTCASVAIWLLIGYLAGSIFASARHPEVTHFLSNGGAVATQQLQEYYAVRDGTTSFCCWCGLLGAQVVFVVQLIARRDADAIGGQPGSPVKEL